MLVELYVCTVCKLYLKFFKKGNKIKHTKKTIFQKKKKKPKTIISKSPFKSDMVNKT